MEQNYSICGLNVRCDFRYGTMLTRSEKYLSEAEAAPDIAIPFPDAQIKALFAENPQLTTEGCENMLTAEMFYTGLLSHGGYMLHSSAVVVDGRAYLFSAPSGTGKSTHTSQWLKLFGERAYILNDDKPALRLTENCVTAYGTPWSGKSNLNVNTGVPVAGICVLERSEQNFIEPLDEGTAIFSILNQTLRPKEEAAMDTLLTYIDRTIATVPVWRMGCNISLDAAQTAYNAMSSTDTDA